LSAHSRTDPFAPRIQSPPHCTALVRTIKFHLRHSNKNMEASNPDLRPGNRDLRSLKSAVLASKEK